MEDEDEYYIVSIDELTEHDWREIQKIALQLKDGGKHKGHQGKCWVEAFLTWFASEEGEFSNVTMH